MFEIALPFLRTPYNYDRNGAGDESGLDCSVEKSLTQQSFAEECDINTIVRRFGLSGELPVNQRAPTYGDFTGVSDYKSALEAVMAAEDAFMQLPAHVRARFENDPQAFVAFCSDEKNREEAIKLGLVVPQAAALAATAPAAAPVATPPSPAPADVTTASK